MLPMGSVGITSECYTCPGLATSTERLSWSRPGCIKGRNKKIETYVHFLPPRTTIW
jgi:hypothetical protein